MSVGFVTGRHLRRAEVLATNPVDARSQHDAGRERRALRWVSHPPEPGPPWYVADPAAMLHGPLRTREASLRPA